MKKCVLVNIYDCVGDIYSAPMLFENEDCAKRYFSTLLVNNPNKDDYKLCFICYYSTDSGDIIIPNGDDESDYYFFDCDLLMKGSEVNA